MGGDSYGPERERALSTQLSLGQQQYEMSADALRGSTGYLTSALGRGGGIDQTGKYDAMRTDVSETAGRAVSQGGGLFGEGGVTGGLAAGAAGATATETQRGSAALDEMNKIRGALATHGLASTGLADQAGALQARAFGMMPNRSPVGSYIGAGLGLASTVYGAGRNVGAWGQPGLKSLPTGMNTSQSWAMGTPGMPSSGTTGSYFGSSGGTDPGGYF